MEKRQEGGKKKYQKPEVAVYGDVRELTRAVGAGGTLDGVVDIDGVTLLRTQLL